ncbi:hypothetical protein [Streptomyces alkaliphilus]|uniref:hypothetical protein n=1 Tax=Streptomyces alkaliphilus TaxID=1472722 RepID=UPI0015F8794A|nr:hypothetical protein [Streptomyces alkaliphilus]
MESGGGPPWNSGRGLLPAEGTTELLRFTHGGREAILPRIGGRLHRPRRVFVEAEGFDEKHRTTLHDLLGARTVL